MAWDEGLVERQREAAAHMGKHARLLAGPGTGKTLTLTRRIVKLVDYDSVPPSEILAITFTRVNAFDLRKSVAKAFGPYSVPMPRIYTLHSYALRQLMRNSRLITTLPQPLRIADDYEEKEIIRPDIKGILGLSRVGEVRDKFDELSADWQNLAPDQPEYQFPDPHFMGAWQTHRQMYGYVLRSELVWQLKHALEENPAFDLEGAKYLLVDEYQDLNRCDLAIVKALSEREAEVFCTGDDDQSIYGFRRAHPEGIRRFLDEYKPSIGFELDVCFRCRPEIIRVGQHVANLDPKRLEKPLRARDDTNPGEVQLLRFADENEEAWAIAQICKHLIEIEGYRSDDILILLRTDYQGKYSSVLKEALEQAGLLSTTKAERWGRMDETQGRYLLCLIRLADNKQDDLSWRTLLHKVRKGNLIGDKTILAIYEMAVSRGWRFHETIRHIEANPDLIRRGKYVQSEVVKIEELVTRLTQLIEVAITQTQITNSDSLNVEKSRLRNALLGCLGQFATKIIPCDEDREPVLDHLRHVAERANVSTLNELLAALSTPEDTFEQEIEEDKINILTMHRAKGLDARAVFVVAAEEQIIPGSVRGEASGDERRLLYVSLTRARERLYITYCNQRIGRQRYSGSESESGNPRRTLSPFLRGAIPPESGLQYVASVKKEIIR